MFEYLPGGELKVWIRPPLVYFDHCAIRSISRDANRRAHLRETFETTGTLMFSVLNMVEMARNSGESYDLIRDTLDELGPHCLPTDLDLATVENRMGQNIAPPVAFLVVPEMLVYLLRAMPKPEFRFGTALATLQGSDFRERAAEMLRHPETVRAIKSYRERQRRGEKMVPLPKPKYSLRWIEISLMRRLIGDSKTVEDNDVTDALHAVVPLAFVHVVVLDGAWANYAKSLKVPNTHVFAANDAGLRAALQSIRDGGT